MESTLLNIKDFMYTLCKGSVSENVLMNVPEVIGASVNDFVVVSTPTSIRGFSDMSQDKTGSGLVMITLFARGLKSKLFGLEENTAKLGEMQDNLRAAIGRTTSANGVRIVEQGFYEARNSHEGFHALSIIFNLKTL